VGPPSPTSRCEIEVGREPPIVPTRRVGAGKHQRLPSGRQQETHGDRSPASLSIPTSTARSVRSSSQSISSSAKARLSGCPQNSPIRSARSKVGEHQDVEKLGAGSRPECVQALAQAALELVGAHLT
jgi:hypothetical protein